ncbi:endonuclease MutS2 [Sulfobacillus thermosulfidooxidans]|uniref:endonuclease MutS2 n=1 Tax=Sulfobacillus thermosulfidooxidans TaxID=28034 RepID=UPI0002E32FFF|nr:endonuclease MutS2 [Sulfobacillus thermosulfidooxidans]
MNNGDTIAESRLRVSLDLVQFPEVLERIAGLADTVMGKKRIKSAQYIRDYQQLLERHRYLHEIVRLLNAGDNHHISLQGATEITRDVKRAAKGGILSQEQLLGIGLTLKAAQEAKNWVTAEDYPILFHMLDAIPSLTPVSQAIFRIIDEEGQIRDSASPQLRQIRRNIQQAELEIDRILEGILHSSHWAEYIQDAIVTIRAGRRVIPVKAMFRHQVPGIVHDRSSSGQTVFVEPMPVVQKQNQLTELHQQEDEEIRRLLTELSRTVGVYHQECAQVEDALGTLDELLGIARYGLKTQSILPTVGGDELRLVEARHPLIDNPVPLDLSLERTRHILIVTGPNTGGKTVTLKTTGLIVSMALSGMMVPCREGTSIPLFDRIWVDIGDEQSIEQNLSTFSSHMARLIPMMEFADDKTLCLIDELGAGTDPDEGSALAEAMIHHLRERKVYAIVTTHYSRLKLLGFRLPDVENAQVAFDRETLTPTYHLIMGQPGSSHALYIARRLGMPEEIIQQARTLMDEEGTTLADVIEQANHLQMELREAKQQVADQQRVLRQKIQEMEKERRVWLERNEREKLHMRDQWQKELQQLHDEMMAAIETVRQSQGPDQARAVEALREIWRQRGILPQSLQPPKRRPSQMISAGDYVHVRDFEGLARVLEVNGKMALVEVGTLRVKLPIEDLERAEAPKRSQGGHARTAMALKAQNLRIECDVRGMTVDEMLDVVDKYLDDAVLAGAFQVRIIHGKGTGTLRKAVTQMLKDDPRVSQFRLGERGEGGDGVTVVTLGSGE